MKRTYSLIISIGLYFLFISWSCSTNSNILIENNSINKIDSLVIYFNSYKVKVTDLLAEKSSKLDIPLDSIKGVQITIVPYIYYNDTSVNGAAFYNDISGLFKSGNFVISENMSSTWNNIEY